MKLQAHLPTFGIEPRDWHAATIALISLFGAVALLLTLQSGSLLDNPLLGRMTTSPIIGPQTSVSKRISLGLRLWDTSYQSVGTVFSCAPATARGRFSATILNWQGRSGRIRALRRRGASQDVGRKRASSPAQIA